jgi:hypothetical protein
MSSATDSTGNNTISAVNSPSVITGKVGDAYSLNGSNQSINIGKLGTFGSDFSQATIQKWQKTTQTTRSIDGSVQSAKTSFLVFYSDTNGGEFVFVRDDSDKTIRIKGTTGLDTDMQDGTWRLYTVTLDRTTSGNNVGYLDGVSRTTVSLFQTPNNFVDLYHDWHIGAWNNGGSVIEHIDGDIDEYRIRESVISPNHIAAEYNNQNSYSTFYSVAAVAGGSTPAQAARRGAVMMG